MTDTWLAMYEKQNTCLRFLMAESFTRKNAAYFIFNILFFVRILFYALQRVFRLQSNVYVFH
jgi:hypothetical protein